MSCRTMCLVLQRRLASSAAALRPEARSHRNAVFSREASSAAALRPEARSHRNAVFSREQARQRALFPRVEKIEVSLEGPGLQGTMMFMNKGMSTPLSCARHLTEFHVNNSALALVNGQPWSLHRPLTQSCTLSLLGFKDHDPTHVNQAYWRSCTALLGQVLETAFKEDYAVELLPSPEVPVTSGAFVCDVVMDPQLDAWSPNEDTLRALTRAAHQLIHQNLAWEPLEVAPPVALEVFSHCRSQQLEVEKLAALNPNGTVSLYRCGDHVLLSGGPLVSRIGLCSQYEVTAVHNLGPGPVGLQRRVQGLSLPLQLQAHHTVWRKLRHRAAKLVEVAPPTEEAPPTPTEETPPPPGSMPRPPVYA